MSQLPMVNFRTSISAMDSHPWHIIRRHYYQIVASQWQMVRSGRQGSVLSTFQILDPSMKGCYQHQPWNLALRTQLKESRHMTYHTTPLLPNSCGPMLDGPFPDPKRQSYPHPQILDPSMKGWYQYQSSKFKVFISQYNVGNMFNQGTKQITKQ